MAIIIDLRTGKILTSEEARARAAAATAVPGPALSGKNKIARNAMLAKVHMAINRLGIDEDAYRFLLDEKYGVNTAAKLSMPQLDDLLSYFQAMGAGLKRGNNRGGAPAGIRKHTERGTYLRKIEALLTEKGRDEGRHIPWEYAVGILKRQTRGAVISLDKAGIEQLRKVIAALSYDARRKGRYAGTWGEKHG